MQKFIEHCHMLCIHSGLISYIEYIISFNRVTDIQYFIALEGDAVQPSYALIWGSRCKVFSGAILDTMQYTTFQKGLFLSECLPRVNGEDLFVSASWGRTGGQRLAWEWWRSEGQIQSNYRKTTFWLVPSKNKFHSKEAISPLSDLTIKMTNLHPLICPNSFEKHSLAIKRLVLWWTYTGAILVLWW